MASGRFIRSAAAALLCALLALRWPERRADVCLRPELFVSPRCPLVRDYGHARQLFLRAAARAGAELHALRPVQGDDSLVTDVAVLRGAGTGLLLHVSGTHGVEGFIGSAIQRAALADRVAWLPVAGGRDAPPTVVFVHALNPFGMAHWRRADEGNVDLNRNCLLSPPAWRAALDPDREGERAYSALAAAVADPSVFAVAAGADAAAIAGPREGLWGALAVAFRTLRTLAAHGAGPTALKRALVSGTYVRARSLFFGGKALRPAHAGLHALLGAALGGEMAGAARVVVLDVHSGLGPTAKDTLMASVARGPRARAALGALGAGAHAVDAISALRERAADGSGAASGYELMLGGTDQCLAELVAAAGGGGELLLSVAQEFGTRRSPHVLRALVEENQAYWRSDAAGDAPARNASARALDPARLPFAAQLLDAFAPADAAFAAETVARGVGVLARAVAQLSIPDLRLDAGVPE